MARSKKQASKNSGKGELVPHIHGEKPFDERLPQDRKTRMRILALRRDGLTNEEIAGRVRDMGFRTTASAIGKRIETIMRQADDASFANELREYEAAKLEEMDLAFRENSLSGDGDKVQVDSAGVRIKIHAAISNLYGLGRDGAGMGVSITGGEISVSFAGDVQPPPHEGQTIDVEEV